MRQSRVQAPETIFHITSRGNNQQDIFLSDADRLFFIGLLENAVHKFSWRCHAYCLMTNHFHLVIEIDELNLSAGMHNLNTRYAQSFNYRNNRHGHLFQDRFFSNIIDNEPYFFAACCYIVLNPVRAGLARHPAGWHWSSYRQTSEGLPIARFLDQGRLLMLCSDRMTEARHLYKEYVEAWMDDAETSSEKREDHREQPERPSLSQIFDDPSCGRNETIKQAYFIHCYNLREIGAFLGISTSTVGRIIKANNGKATVPGFGEAGKKMGK